MKIKFFSFIEGEKYSGENIPKKFIKNGYFKKNNDGLLTAKVCGVSILDRRTYIFLPKGFKNLYGSNVKADIGKSVFKSLNKYKDSVRLNEEESEWLGDENENVEQIETI